MVFVGLGFVAFGIKGADAIAAILVAIFVLYAGYRLGKRTIDNLLDAAPVGMTDEIKTIAQTVTGVLEIGRIRVRPAGPSTFIDLIIHVSRKTPLERTHKISQLIEQKIHEKIANSDIVIHVKPVAINNENMIERIQIVSSSHNLVANNILIQNLVGKKILNFDLEVKEITTLEEGHKAADHIEKTLQKEFGEDTEINIHIEPMNRTEIITDKIDKKKLDQINQLIANFLGKNPLISDIHNLKVRSDNKKLHISFHGVIKGKTGIVEAHDLTHNFEEYLKDALPDAEKVTIHIEPEKCV